MRKESLLEETVEIANAVEQNQMQMPTGETGWYGFDTDHNHVCIKSENGIYSGQLGVAIFFAAMYKVHGDERYLNLREDAIDHLFSDNVDEIISSYNLGCGDGIGSLIYGLSVISELTEKPVYEDKSREIALSIPRDEITSSGNVDVLSGVSGLLLSLLRLYEQTGDKELLDKAINCGEHLLTSRYSKWGHEVWDTFWVDDFKSFSTGMGHGAAGICYSLYRLHGHCGRDDFRRAADDAILFENVFYSESQQNWKANWTHIPHYPLWWCYGLPGIGLARLGSLEHVESDLLHRDLKRAKNGLEPTLGIQDSICHGTFAQVDFLIELSRREGSEYLQEARKVAQKSVRRKRRRGSYRVANGGTTELYNPVLFLGTAGIGYTLLRLTAPAKVPSILRFE